MSYLNYYEDYKVLPERAYFFGILGTVYPDYLSNLIRHANKIRNITQEEESIGDQILIKDDIFKKLQSEPFFSSIILLLMPLM